MIRDSLYHAARIDQRRGESAGLGMATTFAWLRLMVRTATPVYKNNPALLRLVRALQW